jgi:hypothetical protein
LLHGRKRKFHVYYISGKVKSEDVTFALKKEAKLPFDSQYTPIILHTKEVTVTGIKTYSLTIKYIRSAVQ